MTTTIARRRAKPSSHSTVALPAADSDLRREAERLIAQTVGKRIGIHSVSLAQNDNDATLTSRSDHALCRAICQTKEGRRQCAACYRENLAAAREQTEPRVFVCHAGLSSITLPSEKGATEALIVGRAFPQPLSTAQKKMLAAKLRKWSGGSDIRRLLDKPPVVSESDLLLAALIVRNLAAVQTESLPRAQIRRKNQQTAKTVSESSARHWRRQRICQRVAEIIETDYAQPLSVAQIAARVNLTPNYLSSLFRKTMRLTLSEHIARVRVQKAQPLLAQSLLQIKEVAFKSGFTDPNHFAVVFKRITGQTPTQWRAGAEAKILGGSSSDGASR